MISFQWNSDFETGLDEVDHQHHRLVELINAFANHVQKNKVASDSWEDLFTELTDYAVHHFNEEESLMESFGVDSRHRSNHARIHAGFVKEVTLLHQNVARHGYASCNRLLSFLTHWLVHHILGQDQNMARQIDLIKQGCSPDEAYRQAERSRDSATGPLLTALNGLLEEVSLRNRELSALNQSLEQKVRERTRALSDANARLTEISNTDMLTGLPNRRYAMMALKTLWTESPKNGRQVSCMMIDADHFKQVNDAYGHDAGDDVLIELAKTIRHAIRTDDVASRLGGDEFFVICPDTGLEGCLKIAEEVRATVDAMRVPTGGTPWHGSVSIGVAACTDEMAGHLALIKAADRAVYGAKEAGKNCVRTIQTIS